MTQPITRASVFTSGAMMSVFGPMTPAMAWVKLRVAASSRGATGWSGRG